MMTTMPSLKDLQQLLRANDARLALLEAERGSKDYPDRHAALEARRRELHDQIAAQTDGGAQRLPYSDGD